MDEATLLSHKALWGREPSPVSRDLLLLKASKRFKGLTLSAELGQYAIIGQT